MESNVLEEAVERIIKSEIEKIKNMSLFLEEIFSKENLKLEAQTS